MKKCMALFLLCIMTMMFTAVAAAQSKGKILFVPHDNRPVSFKQSVDTLQRLGYEVLVPPIELLGGRTDLGHPAELWRWVNDNADDADAAVLSSDSLIYGSLVASRKHDFDTEKLLKRAEKFASLRERNPKLRIYAFGSIMRTPRSGEASGSEEPDYYAKYGADIFRYTALLDKEDAEVLSRAEKREIADLKKSIPEEAINDWLGRRQKNFAVNRHLIDFARDNVFNYLALGRDDNAPYSQTHKESRLLEEDGKILGETRFQTLAGIDEIGLLLLTRAVNDLSSSFPLVNVRYAAGQGGDTIPSYSDEAISQSIRSHLLAIGAIQVPTPLRANLVLLVNTNPNGRTYEANDPQNTSVPRENTKSFADMVDVFFGKKFNVSVADISYANGADNALMAELAHRGLLSKLTAYAGWNTATNSTGFAVAQGILNAQMKPENRQYLLATRYLDDWVYQANVRQSVAGQLDSMRGTGSYAQLDGKKSVAARRTTIEMDAFIKKNIPDFKFKLLQVDFPWNRMFEADIDIK